MVAEKLPSPRTLFKEGVRHVLVSSPCWVVVWGLETLLTWGWSWSAEGKGWSWEVVGSVPPWEERSHLKEGVLGSLGLIFSHPTILFLQQ